MLPRFAKYWGESTKEGAWATLLVDVGESLEEHGGGENESVEIVFKLARMKDGKDAWVSQNIVNEKLLSLLENKMIDGDSGIQDVLNREYYQEEAGFALTSIDDIENVSTIGTPDTPTARSFFRIGPDNIDELLEIASKFQHHRGGNSNDKGLVHRTLSEPENIRLRVDYFSS